MNNPLKYRDPSGHCFDDSLACRYINKMKQATVDAMQSGVDAVYGTSKAIADFMLLDDLRTVTDENASNFDKGLAAAGFVPWGKIIRSGKLVIQMGNKAGKYIERASNLTDDNLKYAEKLAWNCNCFVAGTKVQTDEGEKNIEDIEVGDKVLSKDENNPDGELAYKEVTALYRNQRDDIIKLHVGEQIIETTNNHPFWVEGKGWVLADEVQEGDKLQKADGSNLTIDKVEFVKLDEKVTVYNFTVADFHTYYVTDIGIWVHNTKGPCSIDISDSKMYQLGDHFNKHGRGMGYASKKDYDAAAKEFANTHQSNPNAKILEGTWNGPGTLNGTRQRAIIYDGKTVVIDVKSGQVIDYFTGTQYKGINVTTLQ
ncbi:HINT domain-containing protein [Paenibacillus chitinolyticus]|nr:HINT domain-containing protein [Paenibacillus chitinolyticus]